MRRQQTLPWSPACVPSRPSCLRSRVSKFGVQEPKQNLAAPLLNFLPSCGCPLPVSLASSHLGPTPFPKGGSTGACPYLRSWGAHLALQKEERAVTAPSSSGAGRAAQPVRFPAALTPKRGVSSWPSHHPAVPAVTPTSEGTEAAGEALLWGAGLTSLQSSQRPPAAES